MNSLKSIVKSVLTESQTSVSNKGLTISGNINDMKDFREEIEALVSGESTELSNRFSDLLFYIDTNYQSYHGLEADNWGVVH